MASAAIVAKTVRFRTTDETLYSGVDDTATSNGIGQSTSALRNVVYTSTLGNFPQIRFLRGSDNKKYAVIAGKLVKKHTDSGSPSRRRVRSTQRAWELTRRHTPVDPFAVILGGADQLEDDGRRKTHMFLRRCMQPLAQYRSGSTVVLENVDRRRTIDVAPTDLTSTGRRRARQTASTWFSSRNDKMTAIRTPAPPQTKTDPVTSSPVIGNLSAKGRQQMVPNLARVNPPSPMVKTPTRERFSATTPGSVEDQNGLNYTDTAKQHSDDAMTTDNHDARGHHISADDDKMGRHRKKVFDAWRMFRRAVRLVKILLGMVSLVTEKQNEVDVSMEKGAVRTVTDLAAQPKKDEQSGDTGLTFDVFYYKANKEINVSSEVRSILSMPPETRTQKQLQTAMYGLQHLKSFAEYPLPMQEKLCKVGWFQHIPPKRIIIRQGHYAENFYFILFGQVIVEKIETNILSAERQLRTVAIIGKGGSFGEIALKQLSKRTATVISKDTVQLLAIGRNDFFNIFMPKQGPDAIPEHVTFISTLKFMNRWPVETLLYHPEACLLHFFKPGVVIVNDSNKSEYLYIVKSGSCQVMKRLHVAKSVRVKAAMADNHILPDRIESKTDSGLPRPEPAQIPGPLQHTMNEYTARIQREAANKQPTCGGTCGDNCTAAGKTQVINDISLLPLETSVGLSRSKYSYIDNLRKRRAINVEAIVPGGLPTTRRSSAPEVIHTKAANQLRHVGIRSHHADEGMRHHANDYSEPCVRAARSMFTTINVLKPKDIFGLSTLDLGITVKTFPTSVSLVSNGAECIMLSSKFFVSNANDEVIENLRQITHDYPDEETLQDDLQKKVTWDCYKRRLMHMTLKSKNITTS